MTAKKLYIVRVRNGWSDGDLYCMRGPDTFRNYTSRREDAALMPFSEARAVRDRLNAEDHAHPKAPKHELEIA